MDGWYRFLVVVYLDVLLEFAVLVPVLNLDEVLALSVRRSKSGITAGTEGL